MQGKTKRKILAIELAGLIIVSVFVASILAGRAENKPLDNLAIERNDDTIHSQEDTTPEVIFQSQNNPSSGYVLVDFTWSPGYPDVGEKIMFVCNCYYGYGMFIYESWDFGDGTRGWGQMVSHTYNKKGDYTVALSVMVKDFSSGELNYGSSTNTVEIGASPFARFTWSPKEPTVGDSVYFDASKSNDINGEIVEYNWSYTEASEPNKVIEMGNNVTFNYVWSKQGNYKVKLIVADNDNNTNEMTQNIVISILGISKVSGRYRHLVFDITNRGNITAENIQWRVYINRNILMIPLPFWKICYKTGTIDSLGSGQSTSVDIGRIRRAFGRVTITITVEASNAVQITESLQGSILGKFVHVRQLYIY